MFLQIAHCERGEVTNNLVDQNNCVKCFGKLTEICDSSD